MKFHIFDKLLHVQTDSGNHSIATDSENFDLIRDSLLKGHFPLVETLIKSEHRLDIAMLHENDEEYYFKGDRVPTTICDLLVNESTSSLAVLNYWINKTVKNEPIKTETLLKLIGKSVFPVDQSGFLFLTDQPIDGPEFFTCKLSLGVKVIFKDGIEGVCQHYFGKATKKLVSISKKQIFRDNAVDDSFFNCAQFISQYQPGLDLDSTIKLLDSPLIDAIGGNNKATIRVVANLLGGVFNAGKLLHLLDKEEQLAEFKNNFNIIADCWRKIEGKITLKKKYQNFSDLILFLTLEAKKDRNANFELKQDLNHPWVLKLEGPIDSYHCQVARTSYELLEWSTVLGNCLDKYPKRVLNGKIMVVGLMVNGVVEYAVEIEPDGEIGQFSGKSGSSPPIDLQDKMKNRISAAMP